MKHYEEINETYDLFISYSNKDKEKIDAIVDAIRYYKINCWYQRVNSKGDFILEINKGIERSSAFVVFVSKSSIKSIMVKNEITRALKKYSKNSSFKIVPIIIDDICEEDEDFLQLYLGSFNWIYEKEYVDYFHLALVLFSQIGIRPRDESLDRQSIYTGNESSEKTRINLQNIYFNNLATSFLDDIFLNYELPTILDIGCSDGNNILLRIKNRNFSGLLGVDNNQRKIEEAKVLNNSKCSFIYCDVETQDLDAVLSEYLQREKKNGFDIIHISSVLLHLNKPNELLKRLYKYLSYEGTIFIQDEDDGLNLVSPKEIEFEDCFYIWDHSFQSGDRKMGRKIPQMLLENNYKDIKLLSTCATSVDFNGKYKECLWDLYFNCDLWSVDNASFFDEKKAYELYQKYKSRHPILKKAFMDGKYFIILGIFFISAKKLAQYKR